MTSNEVDLNGQKGRGYLDQDADNLNAAIYARVSSEEFRPVTVSLERKTLAVVLIVAPVEDDGEE